MRFKKKKSFFSRTPAVNSVSDFFSFFWEWDPRGFIHNGPETQRADPSYRARENPKCIPVLSERTTVESHVCHALHIMLPVYQQFSTFQSPIKIKNRPHRQLSNLLHVVTKHKRTYFSGSQLSPQLRLWCVYYSALWSTMTSTTQKRVF